VEASKCVCSPRNLVHNQTSAKVLARTDAPRPQDATSVSLASRPPLPCGRAKRSAAQTQPAVHFAQRAHSVQSEEHVSSQNLQKIVAITTALNPKRGHPHLRRPAVWRPSNCRKPATKYTQPLTPGASSDLSVQPHTGRAAPCTCHVSRGRSRLQRTTGPARAECLSSSVDLAWLPAASTATHGSHELNLESRHNWSLPAILAKRAAT
jgi:hypothetical protein